MTPDELRTELVEAAGIVAQLELMRTQTVEAHGAGEIDTATAENLLEAGRGALLEQRGRVLALLDALEKVSPADPMLASADRLGLRDVVTLH